MDMYEDKELARGLGDARHETVAASKPPIGQEVVDTLSRQLMEQEELISHLSSKLAGVTSYNKGTKERADRDEKGMFSPLVNTLMNYSDNLSLNNSRIREIIEAIEI